MATPTTLPAAFVSGDVLTAAQMNDLRGAFRVLQVVSANYNTQTANSTTTYADTGLTATITPSSTNSKILVLVSQAGVVKGTGNASSGCDLILLRGATQISQFSYGAGFTNTTTSNFVGNVSCMFLDSPATTSATTYKTQFKNQVAASQVIVQISNGSESNIVLLEISA
jgi:hypothetical protein